MNIGKFVRLSLLIVGVIAFQIKSSAGQILLQTGSFAGPDSQSDSDAIGYMTNFLQITGNGSQWQKIGSAKIKATLVDQRINSPAKEILIFADWEKDPITFKRRLLQGSRAAADRKTALLQSTHQTGPKDTLISGDSARTLVAYMPSASSLIILRKSVYLVKKSRPQDCENEKTCVSIYRKISEKGPYLKEQEWTFATKNGLLLSVRRQTSALIGGSKENWERIDYSRYVNTEGFLVPQQVAVTGATGISRNWRISYLQFGGTLNTQDFSDEVVQ